MNLISERTMGTFYAGARNVGIKSLPESAVMGVKMCL
jgi:hypothetical protein